MKKNVFLDVSLHFLFFLITDFTFLKSLVAVVQNIFVFLVLLSSQLQSPVSLTLTEVAFWLGAAGLTGSGATGTAGHPPYPPAHLPLRLWSFCYLETSLTTMIKHQRARGDAWNQLETTSAQNGHQLEEEPSENSRKITFVRLHAVFTQREVSREGVRAIRQLHFYVFVIGIYLLPNIFPPCGKKKASLELVRQTWKIFTCLTDPFMHKGPLMNSTRDG